MRLTPTRAAAVEARRGRHADRVARVGAVRTLHRTFLGDLPTPRPAEREGRRRARALFADVPTVTVLHIGPEDDVQAPSAKALRRAARPGRTRGGAR